jgi:hypothetical protein
MFPRVIVFSVLILCLGSCAEPKVVSADPSEITNKEHNPLSEKCENAKRQLDKSVEEGQLSDLRELKRNIELYCLWRKN